MKKRIIYNNISNKLIILDNNYQIVIDLISDNYLLNNINFNTLPLNIFDNIQLYLGNEYESYNDVDINEIYDILFNKDININNKGYYFNKEQKYLYDYDEKNECLYFSYNNIYSVFESKYKLKNKVIRCLLSGMVEQALKWKVSTTCSADGVC